MGRVWYLLNPKQGARVGPLIRDQMGVVQEGDYGIGLSRRRAPTAVGKRRNAIIRPVLTMPDPGQTALASDKELSDFLKSVERRAFKRVAYAVRDDDAALDIVQDSMIRLAEKYVDRPAAELPLVFHRILSNATMDWFRRQKVRGALFRNFSDFDSSSDDAEFDLLETLAGQGETSATESAADTVSRDQILLVIDAEVSRLPTRQREAFLLRYWEELDVAETAAVMGC